MARFVKDSNLLSCGAGETVTFTAVVDGRPEPTVLWNKGKWRQIKSYGRFKIIQDKDNNTYSLTISTLDKPDTGMYR